MILKGLSGKTYQLAEKPFSSGGEGDIYSITSMPGGVVKVYHADRITQELEEKLLVMCKRPPSREIFAQIAWPVDLAYDLNGAFQGFVMLRLNITDELSAIYAYPPKKNISYKAKVIIAQNICAVISEIHRAGFVFGDFNPKNIGIDLNTCRVAFLDTDSYHIVDGTRTYRCKVCLDGYVAPELLKKCEPYKTDAYARTPLPTFTKETDNFALAIHIFRLLMNGYTPFNGIRESESISTASPGTGNQAIKRDSYCFKPGNKPQSVAVPPLSALPSEIADLFTRAFMYGRIDPTQRPTALEWYKALMNYENSLVSCSNNSAHMYQKELQSCPWCEADDRYAALTAEPPTRTHTEPPLPQKTFSGAVVSVTPPPAVVTPPPVQTLPKPVQQSKPVTQPLRPAQQTPPSVQQPKPVQRSAPQQAKPAIDMSHFQLDVSGRTLVKYVGPGGDVVIPPGVTRIGERAFSPYASERDKQSKSIKALLFNPARSDATIQSPPSLNSTQSHKVIKSVILPQGVTSIGESAFADCSSLQRVVLPQGIRSIGKSAFADCLRLNDIIIPQGITQIESCTFSNCSSLQKVILPPGVTQIGRSAFFCCTNLQHITIPSSVTWVGENAFYHCSKLQRADVALGAYIGEDAFAGCTSLLARPGGELETVGIDLSHFLFDKGDHILKKYVGPGGDVVIPKGITEIGDEAFANCTSLRSIVIPESVKYIGGSAFSRCSNLQHISLPPNIIFYGRNSFPHCTSLQEITLPSGTQMNCEAFFGCTSLRKVTLSPGVTSIPSGTFQCCRKLQEVILPEGLTSIGFRAFCNCDSLREIVLPRSVREMEERVFDSKKSIFHPPITICAPTGSYAQKYARQNGLRFRAI